MAYWQNYSELKEKGLIVDVTVIPEGAGTSTPGTTDGYLVQTTYAAFNPQTGERVADVVDAIPLSQAEAARADIEKMWVDMNAWMADAMENMPQAVPGPPVDGGEIEGTPDELEPMPEVVLPDVSAGNIEEATGVEAVPVEVPTTEL